MSSRYAMMPPNAEKALRAVARLTLLVVLSLAALLNAADQAGGGDVAGSFRWIHPSSDPGLLKQVRAAFQHELAPDGAKPEADWRDVYQYNFLQKVGVVGHSALVIIGHRPAKEVSKGDAWDTFSSAYNFDLTTGQKSLIESSGRLWQWKFRWLATFGPTAVPDVTFTYLTCTECEPSEIFSSLYYQGASSGWQVRTWEERKDLWWTGTDGVAVDADLIEGEGPISFDCVYGLVPTAGGPQGLAIRCKEVSEDESGKRKVNDATLLYGLKNGTLRPHKITDPSAIRELTRRLCGPNSQSMLCKSASHSK